MECFRCRRRLAVVDVVEPKRSDPSFKLGIVDAEQLSARVVDPPIGCIFGNVNHVGPQ